MIYQDYLDLQALQRYATAMNARAKQCHARGMLNADLLLDRILESGGQCEWCSKNLVNQPFELDHVLSLSQNGTNLPDNLVVSCIDCNRRKSTKHPAKFAAEIYSITGKSTSLVDEILKQYQVIPTKQKTLFDEEIIDVSTPIEPDDSPPTSPYNWA